MGDESRSRGTVLILMNHPALPRLLVPVARELRSLDVEVRCAVFEPVSADLLRKAGLSYSRDLDGTFVEFLRTSGPKLFLNGADLTAHKRGTEWDRLCRLYGIPSLTLEHAPFSIGRRSFGQDVLFEADRMAVIGAYDRDRYVEVGVEPDRLVVTGCPQYDGHFERRQADAGRQADGPILFAGQNHTYTGATFRIPESKWVGVLRDLFAELVRTFPGREIQVKPHPAEPHWNTVHLYEDAISEGLEARVRLIDTSTSTEDAVQKASLVASFSGSVALETLLLGRPVVHFDHRAPASESFRDFETVGGVLVLGDPASYPQLLKESRERVLEADSQANDLPAWWVEKYAHRFDGRSARRVADEVRTTLDEPKDVRAKRMITGATALVENGLHAEARVVFHSILDECGEYVEALHGAGVCSVFLGDAAEACRLLRRADELMPGNPEILVAWSVAASHTDTLAELSNSLRSALQANPADRDLLGIASRLWPEEVADRLNSVRDHESRS